MIGATPALALLLPLVAVAAAQPNPPPSSASPPSPSPPSEERCLQAYEQGQRLRLRHALLDARSELLLCAQAACPATFRPECVQWFDEVQHLVPSVIVHVEGDAASTDVRVLVDGKLVASRLDGTAIEVDPGEHVFRFEPKAAPASEQTVLVNEGQKERVIAIRIAPPPPPPSPPTTTEEGTSLTPWIFTGASAVALGSFAYFGATGLARRNNLDKCGQYCAPADVDSVHLRFDIADASLAISAVSLGIAIYEWVSAAHAGRPTTAIHVDARGGAHDAFVGVSGSF